MMSAGSLFLLVVQQPLSHVSEKLDICEASITQCRTLQTPSQSLARERLRSRYLYFDSRLLSSRINHNLVRSMSLSDLLPEVGPRMNAHLSSRLSTTIRRQKKVKRLLKKMKPDGEVFS